MKEKNKKKQTLGCREIEPLQKGGGLGYGGEGEKREWKNKEIKRIQMHLL